MSFPDLLRPIAKLASFRGTQTSYGEVRRAVDAYGVSLKKVGVPLGPVQDLMGLMKIVPETVVDAPAAAQAAVAYLTSQGFLPRAEEDPRNFLARLRRSSPSSGYQIVRPLGQGCFSEVFLAQDKVTGREVALKRYRATILGIFNEIRFQTMLDGKIAVRLLRAGLLGASPYVALEFQSGGTCRGFIRKLSRSKNSSARSVLVLADRILRCAAAVHSAGVLHGDMGIDNFLIGADGDVRLADFGPSRRTDENPYAYEDLGRNDGRVEGLQYDVFNLGKVLYQLFTRYPEDISDLNLTRQPLPRLKRPDLQMPDFVDWIVARALDRDLDRRYADAVVLYEDFRKFSS